MWSALHSGQWSALYGSQVPLPVVSSQRSTRIDLFRSLRYVLFHITSCVWECNCLTAVLLPTQSLPQSGLRPLYYPPTPTQCATQPSVSHSVSRNRSHGPWAHHEIHDFAASATSTTSAAHVVGGGVASHLARMRLATFRLQVFDTSRFARPPAALLKRTHPPSELHSQTHYLM